MFLNSRKYCTVCAWTHYGFESQVCFFFGVCDSIFTATDGYCECTLELDGTMVLTTGYKISIGEEMMFE